MPGNSSLPKRAKLLGKPNNQSSTTSKHCIVAYDNQIEPRRTLWPKQNRIRLNRPRSTLSLITLCRLADCCGKPWLLPVSDAHFAVLLWEMSRQTLTATSSEVTPWQEGLGRPEWLRRRRIEKTAPRDPRTPPPSAEDRPRSHNPKPTRQ